MDLAGSHPTPRVINSGEGGTANPFKLKYRLPDQGLEIHFVTDLCWLLAATHPTLSLSVGPHLSLWEVSHDRDTFLSIEDLDPLLQSVESLIVSVSLPETTFPMPPYV